MARRRDGASRRVPRALCIHARNFTRLSPPRRHQRRNDAPLREKSRSHRIFASRAPTPPRTTNRDSTARSISRGPRASTAHEARWRRRGALTAGRARDTRRRRARRSDLSILARDFARDRKETNLGRSRRRSREKARRATRERVATRCGNGIRRDAPSGFRDGARGGGDARANAVSPGRRSETVEGKIERRSRARGGRDAATRARGGAGVGGNLETGDRTPWTPGKISLGFSRGGGSFLEFRLVEGRRRRTNRDQIPKWRMGKQCEVTDDTWRARERQRTDE